MGRMPKAIFEARIGACAAILRDEKPAKVAQIAEARDVSQDIAARMYVIGALKADVRRGVSRNIAEALERFEGAQVGDRSVSVRGEDSTARDVRRITAYNNRPDAIGDGIALVDDAKPIEDTGRRHRRSMGKVLGMMYVEIEGTELRTTPEVILEREGYDAIAVHMEDEIGAYIDEYVTRLSVTARASIRQIVESAYSDDSIMKGKDSESSKLRERVKYLHHNFPHKEAITSRELLGILRQYATA
jgi:hypothetical protein